MHDGKRIAEIVPAYGVAVLMYGVCSCAHALASVDCKILGPCACEGSFVTDWSLLVPGVRIYEISSLHSRSLASLTLL